MKLKNVFGSGLLGVAFYMSISASSPIQAPDSVIRSVWDTSKPLDVDFCPHVSNYDSAYYQDFFNHVLNIAHRFTGPLEELGLIENIIIVQPDHIRCLPHTVYIVVETYQVTDPLKMKIKEFALRIHRDTNVSISVILKTQGSGTPFAIWQPRKGMYVLCKERNMSRQSSEQSDGERVERVETEISSSILPLTREDWDIILQLARRRRVQLLNAWFQVNDENLHVSIGSFGSAVNLQHFKRELEQRLRKSIRIVLR